MDLRAEGIRVRLPRGWEGSITRNPSRTHSKPPLRTLDPLRASLAEDVEQPAEPDARVAPAEAAGIELPVTHLANFPLPAAIGNFGSTAVDLMDTGDVLVNLVEFGPDEVGTNLFERRPLPRRLSPRDFSPKTLLRARPDHLGLQVFATEAERALCLYVVIQGQAGIGRTLHAVNDALATLEVSPR